MNDKNGTKHRADALVGLKFNPSARADVNELKTLFSRAIQIVSEHNKAFRDSQALREALCDGAVNEIVTAQMWAVKAVTFDAK